MPPSVQPLTSENLADRDASQEKEERTKVKRDDRRRKGSKSKSFNSSACSSDSDAKIFPQRLMEVLADEENHHAINWLPHGKSFMIVNREKFCDQVLPKICSRKSKYSSFTRKLSRWSFARVTRGPEIGSYFHKFFQKDKDCVLKCTVRMIVLNLPSPLARVTRYPWRLHHLFIQRGWVFPRMLRQLRIHSSHRCNQCN